MQKKTEHIEADSDIPGLTLEEVADIPETVSLERVIEGENAPERRENPENDMADGEEIADIRHTVTHSVSVVDEFSEAATRGRPMKETRIPDISSLASEVDTFTNVSREEKIPVARAGESGKVEGNGYSDPAKRPPDTAPKKTATATEARPSSGAGEIIIDEDDDIDIDYYSLEEIEGTALPDMPESDFGPAETMTIQAGPEEASSVEDGQIHGGDETPVQVEKDILTFEIPDDVMEKTAEELELGEWEAIDLGEAEKIANEDILFLREEDLIEELEEFDLIPVKQEPPTDSRPARKAKKPERLSAVSVERKEEAAPAAVQAVSEGHATVLETLPPATALKESKELEVRETLLEITEEGDTGIASQDARPPVSRKEAVFPAEPTVEPPALTPPAEPPVESPMLTPPAGPAAFEEPRIETPPARKAVGSEIRAIDIDEDGEVLTFGIEDVPVREDVSAHPKPATDIGHTPPPRLEPPPARPVSRIVREKIPDALLRIEPEHGRAVFIDDGLVDKELEEKTAIFEVTDLERLTSQIVEIIEGEAKLLSEADVTEDRDRIASVMKGQTPAFEDLLIDMEGEYSFKDDELDIIDNAFAAEDYGSYIGAIDDLAGGSGERAVSTAVELLGLDMGELGSIEQGSFLKEYDKLDIDDLLASAQSGMDQPVSDLDILKKCTYIVAKKGGIFEEERRSIEEDVSAGTALVYEESVDELRGRLEKIRGKRRIAPDEGLPNISDSVIIIENGGDIERFVETMPEGKRDIMRKLLKYLDGLFEKLPEDVIKNFAKSEYFDLYSKVMIDLGV